MITGFHHASMICQRPEEFERAKAFYCGTLGLPVKREWAEGVQIDAGNGLIEIFSNGEGRRETGAIQHISLATDDVDADIEKVRQAGCVVFVEPKDIVIGSTPPCPARIAFFTGPLGEEVELFQEKMT